MKILLLKNHFPLGKKGDSVNVAEGFARNFLFPQNIAQPLNQKGLHLAEQISQKETRKKKQIILRGKLIEKQTRGKIFEIPARTNEHGHLFAQIHAKNIIEFLKIYKIELSEKFLLIKEPIKNIGKFSVWYQFSEDQKCEIVIHVIPKK